MPPARGSSRCARRSEPPRSSRSDLCGLEPVRAGSTPHRFADGKPTPGVIVVGARAPRTYPGVMAAGQDARARRRADARPGDGLVRAGGVVFVLGLIAVLVVVLPFFFGKQDWPLALNLAAGVLPPLGLALALAGLVRSARRTARDNRAASARPGTASTEPNSSVAGSAVDGRVG